MRILLLADMYSPDGTSPWLIEDLAAALVREGHEVDVLAKDMTRPRPYGLQPPHPSGATVYSVGVTHEPTSVWDRRSRLPRAMLRLRGDGLRWARSRRPDAVVLTSISWTKAGLPGLLRRGSERPTTVLVHWDFFPVHQRQIGHLGRLPAAADGALRAIERAAVRQADLVGVMTPRNETFFREYFGADGQQLFLLPPWGSDQAVGVDTSRRADEPFTAVFGGQLTTGRGIDEIVGAAEILAVDDPGVRVQIFGSGPLEQSLRDRIRASGLDNIRLMGAVPRAEYAAALGGAHCGIAATVEGVSVPTFPSKIVDYTSSGLPVVVASERSGDVGRWVEEHGAGLAVDAGDAQQLADALSSVHRRWQQGEPWAAMSRASRQAFETELSAEVAARRIVDQVGSAGRRGP
jgi:glycosyltransferase involved in cell wall biosynthesis